MDTQTARTQGTRPRKEQKRPKWTPKKSGGGGADGLERRRSLCDHLPIDFACCETPQGSCDRLSTSGADTPPFAPCMVTSWCAAASGGRKPGTFSRFCTARPLNVATLAEWPKSCLSMEGGYRVNIVSQREPEHLTTREQCVHFRQHTRLPRENPECGASPHPHTL